MHIASINLLDITSMQKSPWTLPSCTLSEETSNEVTLG